MKTKPSSSKKPASRALVRKPDAPAPAASAALVAMPEPGEALDRAGRVNFFHNLSRDAGVVSIRAALAAGMELLQAKEELSGGFQKWVESKCSFSVKTAYNYINLVQRTLPEQALPKLLAGSDSEREAAVEAAAAAFPAVSERRPRRSGGATRATRDSFRSASCSRLATPTCRALPPNLNSHRPSSSRPIPNPVPLDTSARSLRPDGMRSPVT